MNQPSNSELDPRDHLAILDVISEYSRTFDSEELEAFANLFSEDGCLDTPAGGGTDRASILAWAKARWEDSHKGGTTPRHFQTNTQVRSAGPDRAVATTQLLLVWVTAATGAAEVKYVSRYQDEWLKTAEGWRLQRRSIG
jgi:ketosteroid isomerase-like protein